MPFSDLSISGDGHSVPSPFKANIPEPERDSAGEGGADTGGIEESQTNSSRLQSQSLLQAAQSGPSYANSPASAAVALAPPLASSGSSNSADPHHELTTELRALYASLQECLEMRSAYMGVSLQEDNSNGSRGMEGNPKNWDAEFCERWWKSNEGKDQTEGLDLDLRIKVDGSAALENELLFIEDPYPTSSSRSASSYDVPKGMKPKPWRIYPAPPRPHWEHEDPDANRHDGVEKLSSTSHSHSNDISGPPRKIPPASPANAKAAQQLLENTGGKPGVWREADVEWPGEHFVLCPKQNGDQGEKETRKAKVDFGMDESGVCQVWVEEEETSSPDQKSSSTEEAVSSRHPPPLFHIPTLRTYFKSLDKLISVISSGPTKSFAWRRLKYLESKWGMYALLNEYRELSDMKRVPHR